MFSDGQTGHGKSVFFGFFVNFILPVSVENADGGGTDRADRDAAFTEQIGKTADVVFVRMRDKNALKLGHGKGLERLLQDGERLLRSRVYQIKKSVGFEQDRVGFSDVQEMCLPRGGGRFFFRSVFGRERSVRSAPVPHAAAESGKESENNGQNGKDPFHLISPDRAQIFLIASSQKSQQ